MESILNYLNNYFYKFVYSKEIEIKDSEIKLTEGFKEGQFIAIEGSVLNDGVYRIENITTTGIKVMGAMDEVFNGRVYGLAIPKGIVQVSEEVATFNIENRPTAFKSESNQGYSYNKGNSTDGTTGATWVEVFGNRLKPYRCMYKSYRGVEKIGN